MDELSRLHTMRVGRVIAVDGEFDTAHPLVYFSVGINFFLCFHGVLSHDTLSTLLLPCNISIGEESYEGRKL